MSAAGVVALCLTNVATASPASQARSAPQPCDPVTTKAQFRGTVTVFGYEPNFRAVADGSARLLRAAILHTPIGSVPWTTSRTV